MTRIRIAEINCALRLGQSGFFQPGPEARFQARAVRFQNRGMGEQVGFIDQLGQGNGRVILEGQPAVWVGMAP